MASTVDFTLHPAIRNGTGKSGDCAVDSFSCPDEPCGCPYTRWALCGMHAEETFTQGDQVRFLTCYDSQNIPYSSDWVTYDEMPNPMQAALYCAQMVGLNQTTIQSCGGNLTGNVESGNYTEVVGEQGRLLAIGAADYFYDTFFKSRTGVKFYVPNLYIQNVEQDLENLVDSWNVTKTLCSVGAQADICKVAAEAGNPTWDGDVRRDIDGKAHHNENRRHATRFDLFQQHLV